ncbi:probable WRKY transcription factor 70 [Trifolium pratense]|uniref:probable WRKY transcription factor 70 n=1 Tax=Trifolium pratense TaxID=57577 RepID=UPI001E69026F|nr:probable WRKY transcription factor 70 [Trifolium pratense]
MLKELRLNAYENAQIYKDRTKKLHDRRILRREFKGELVLLFNSRLRLFLGKLRSRWSGPFEVTRVFQSGAIEIKSQSNETFTVNEQQLNYACRNTTQTWEEVTKIPTDDDGHRWRKYGQKKINNSQYSRNYYVYRCTHKYDQSCLATKQVHRIQQKPPLYKTTYYGHHTCGKYMSNPHIILDPNIHTNSSILLSFNNTFPNPTKQECPFLSSSSSSLLSTSPSLSSSPNSLEYKDDVPSSSLDDNLLSPNPTLDDSISTRHVSTITISSTLDEFDHKDMMYGFSNDFVEFDDDFFHPFNGFS